MSKKEEYKQHLKNYAQEKDPKVLSLVDKGLTVGQLKKALSNVSDDTLVLVRHYETPTSCSEVVCRKAYMEETPFDSTEVMEAYTPVFAIEGVEMNPKTQQEYEDQMIMEDN